MTFKFKSVLTFAIGLALFLPHAVFAGPCKNVLIYYTSWSKYNSPAYNYSTIPYNQITHISYAFIEPNADGSLSITGDYMGADGVHYDGVSMVQAAHAAGVKVLLCCGGSGAGSTNYPAISASTSLTNTFASNLLAYCQANHFDGVDIDWEFPNTTALASQFDNLLAGIRAQMPASQWILSAALSADSYSPYFLNISTLNNYLTFFNLMCYDYHGSWLAHSGDTASLFEDSQDPSFSHEASGVTVTNYYISQGAAPSKINYGLPFYGYGYPTAGLYQNCGGNCNTTTLTYAAIEPLVGNGWTRNFDNTSESPNITYNSGTSVISYDDSQSITIKANYVLNTLGVGGIFAWSADQDYNGSTQPLLSAMYQSASAGCAPTSTPTITPTPTNTGTATFTPTAVVASTWRVNAGGANYTDCQSNLWIADTNFTGGTGAASTGAITGALPCTTDQTLYKDQRYGANFSYAFNVPAGSYQVLLKFAETYSGDYAVGDRVFDVYINSTEVLTNFDVYAKAGGATALDEVFNNITPSGGLITIQFKGTTSTDPNALVEGLQIVPMPATSTYTPTWTPTATATVPNTATASNTATVAMTATPTSTLTNSNTPTASFTPTATATLTRTPTATVSMTFTSSFTATNTPAGTWTSLPTSTPTNTYSPTASDTPSLTATFTSSFTDTPTPVNTATSTATKTPVPATSTPTNSWTPSATVTNTPTATRTATASSTVTPTATYSLTSTPSWTASHTGTATFTSTMTNTPRPEIPTATPTLTLTPTFTKTAIPPTNTATMAPGCSGIPLWNGNFVAYSVGQKVDFNNEIYECIQAHTSEPNWQPPAVPALWKDMGPCGATPTTTQTYQSPVVYPNPVTAPTVSIYLPALNNTGVKVQIFTVAMREVQSLSVAQVPGNTLTVALADRGGTSLANGIYYFVIQDNGEKWINKVLVLR